MYSRHSQPIPVTSLWVASCNKYCSERVLKLPKNLHKQYNCVQRDVIISLRPQIWINILKVKKTCKYQILFRQDSELFFAAGNGSDGRLPSLQPALGIHDILLRIRIRGSVPLTNRSGSNSGFDYFLQ